MSALGQKQTCAVQKGMSALPPIATAKADFRKRSCPLYPRKRTCAVITQCLLWAKSGHSLPPFVQNDSRYIFDPDRERYRRNRVIL